MTIFEKNRKTHTMKLTWVDQWSHICNNNSGSWIGRSSSGGGWHTALSYNIFRRQSVGECTSVGKHENARGQIRSPSHIWPIKYKLIGVLILLFHRIVGSSWSWSSILYHGQCQSTRALSPFNWRTNYRPVYCVFRFVSWYLTELCGAKTQETKRENSSVS